MIEITKDISALKKDLECAKREIASVTAALATELNSVTEEGTAADLIERIETLKSFDSSSSETVAAVEVSLRSTSEKFNEMASFFGEDQSNVGSILTTLSEFIDHFSHAKQAHNRKAKKRPL